MNQKNPLLHDIGLGDSLWAFTRRDDGAYVLAAELVVTAKTRNPPGFEYGPFRVWGDLGRSRYFSIEEQEDVTELVKGLSVTANASTLGQSFQGPRAVKRLSEQDHQVLAEYARNLAQEPRAQLLPEETIESLLLNGHTVELEALLLRAQGVGIGTERRLYLLKQIKRSRALAQRLREIYAGRCQICCWNPQETYRTMLSEAHHLSLAKPGWVG